MNTSSKGLNEFDHFGSFLVLDNHRLSLLIVFNDSNDRVRIELSALVTNGMELEESIEVLHSSFDRLSLGIVNMHITEVFDLVVNVALSTHDHDFATIQHRDSWRPSGEQLGFGEGNCLPHIHSLCRTFGVDHELYRIKRTLISTSDSTEDIDCAVHSASTSHSSCLIQVGHDFPNLHRYVESFTRASTISTESEDVRIIKLAQCEFGSSIVHRCLFACCSGLVDPSATLRSGLSLEELIANLNCHPALFATCQTLACNLFVLAVGADLNDVSRVSQVEVKRLAIRIARGH